LPRTAKPHVLLDTTNGEVEIELDATKAPISVKNFLGYVDSGFYNNTIFHRVIPGFMVQGGGFTEKMGRKTKAPIKNEADNGLLTRAAPGHGPHLEVNSATSQFFINVTDNDFLNQASVTSPMFGKVVKAWTWSTSSSTPHHQQGMQDVPKDPCHQVGQTPRLTAGARRGGLTCRPNDGPCRNRETSCFIAVSKN
jgi:peptidyl-prolyl cis-trans isomerase A (cyclophilin A)